MALGNKILCVGHTTVILCSLLPPSFLKKGSLCLLWSPQRGNSVHKERAKHEQRGAAVLVAAEILAGSHLSWLLLHADTVEYSKLGVFIPTVMSCLCTGRAELFRHWEVLLKGERMGCE